MGASGRAGGEFCGPQPVSGHDLQGQWLEPVGVHARVEAQCGGFLRAARDSQASVDSRAGQARLCQAAGGAIARRLGRDSPTAPPALYREGAGDGELDGAPGPRPAGVSAPPGAGLSPGRDAGAHRHGHVQRGEPGLRRPGRLRGHALPSAVAGLTLPAGPPPPAGALPQAHHLCAGAGGGRWGTVAAGVAAVARAGLGAGAGPVGDHRRQGNPPCRRGVGQRGQRQRSLAGFHLGAGHQQRNPHRSPAIGPVGPGGQDRAGRRGSHSGGASPTNSLRARGRLSPDGQKEPKGTLCYAGNALCRPALFPLDPRRAPGP